jgi:hypothetical protein
MILIHHGNIRNTQKLIHWIGIYCLFPYFTFAVNVSRDPYDVPVPQKCEWEILT